MSLNDHMDRIREQYGRLTPAVVVDASRSPEAPLHSHFDWDDHSAAESHRRAQAANLIRQCRVVYAETPDGQDKSVRAYMPVRPTDDDTTADYVPVQEVMADPFTRQMTLRACEREWKAFQRKYGHLQEFAAVVAGDAAVSA